ncbi:hypothetical protein [Vibrio coralliirubri]|uniref:hypothetical protein n=1 Tax=Vibrio coralliirubri TaxID=1516159 RepID=UPI002284B7A0|nr:hypothetical protein [Vibrio coralliirubri]
MKPLDALTSTLDNALVPYIQNDTLLLSATSGVCRILLSHNSMFLRRMVASFVVVMLTLVGVVMKEPILAIGSGFTLILVDYICKPVTELHKDQKII